MTKIKPTQDMLDLYDLYAHGLMGRRDFVRKLGGYAAVGLSVGTLMQALMPDYALANQVGEDDPRFQAADIEYASPDGAGVMGGYFLRPTNTTGKVPGVVVIHENRGLNPYIRDVARRVAIEGYMVLAPDALYPSGGYPGNDDDGRVLQRQRDRDEMTEDFAAAVRYLQGHEGSSGKVGCVGFCFGGSVSNKLAASMPDLAAAVPFYGSAPALEDVPNIHAPLLIHLAELDKRVNAGWPDYEAALKAAGKEYQMHMYAAANHGFHNDTTQRYDADAAELAWSRTLEFFRKNLH